MSRTEINYIIKLLLDFCRLLYVLFIFHTLFYCVKLCTVLGNVSSNPYPQKREQPWEEQWEADFGYVADTCPVICTEIGYCLPEEPGAHIPVMSTDVYGEHITRYLEQKGISFTVWCFDVDWGPMLISDWDFTPTTQGRFFKAYLQGVGR